MRHSVPYYSQFVDVKDPFWMLRACGMTSLLMVMEFFDGKQRDIVSLCEKAKEEGGYDMENGWIHDYLVAVAEENNFEAYRKEGLESISKIANHLQKEGPVIVSVEKRLLEQKRFHMLVLTGCEINQNGDVVSLSYHEPESTVKEKGTHRTCDTSTFLSYWRGKAIFIFPKIA